MRSVRRSHVAVLVAVVALLALGAAGVAPADAAPPAHPGVGDRVATTGASAQTDACAALSNGTGQADPSDDRLGWENGCWHDERLAISPSDGLNATEREALLARSMARVEVVRELEFEGTPDLEIVSRQAFAERVDEAFAASEESRLRENVKWEALLMVGENTDAVEVLRSNAAGAGGYYSPEEDRMVVVAEDPSSPRMNELLLAHELVHPLQNQQFDAADRFDLSTFEQRRTTESQNAINGLVEGDAQLVQIRYWQRCNAEWNCTTPAVGGDAPDPHRGLDFVNSFAYYDGPKFVHDVRQAGGWSAVDDLYEDPPESTEQVLNASNYPDEEPATVEFGDESADGWRIPEVDTGQPEYASVGIPGITSTFVYTVYDTSRQQPAVLPIRVFNNDTGDGLDLLDPYTYENNPYASGWEGDRLYPYVRADSAASNETGYVWKIDFETGNDSAAFADGYVELLEYYNATAVEDRADTYRIPDGDSFGDAFYVDRTGDTVVVVNAPTVEALSEVRDGAAPEADREFVPGLPDGPAAWLAGGGVVALLAAAAVLGRRGLGRDD